MPDLYRCTKDDSAYTVFWYEGEFYLGKNTSVSGSEYPEKRPTREDRYFDTTDEVLKAMLEIAPYKDWKVARSSL